tara:strand:+ start:2663 stop:3820 length:1158 start_codon:yes stop_codon:yes gene_type:complete
MTDIAANPMDSYDLTTETPINIDTIIKLLNYDELPMLGGTGGDGFSTIAKSPVDNTIFYWQTQDLPVPRTTVLTALTTTTTALVVAAGAGVSFAVGDAVKIGDEIVYISAISTDTLTITRAQAGTSDPGTTYTTGTDVIGLGTFLNEGEIGTQQFRGRDKHSNYTQIWTSQIDMTRTQQRIPKYGVDSELGNLVRQVALSEGQNREQAFLYGDKFQSDPKRMTGGLSYYLTSNVIGNGASGDWLTVTEIEKRQQVSYDAGGMFDTIVSRPRNFAALNNAEGAERVRTDWTDEYRGRRRAVSVVTEFGEVELYRNRHVKATDAFGLNREDLSERVFQPMVMQPLAKTDDRDKWMFVCEGGFQVKGQEHMVYWSGLDNTAAFPSNLA